MALHGMFGRVGNWGKRDNWRERRPVKLRRATDAERLIAANRIEQTCLIRYGFIPECYRAIIASLSRPQVLAHPRTDSIIWKRN